MIHSSRILSSLSLYSPPLAQNYSSNDICMSKNERKLDHIFYCYKLFFFDHVPTTKKLRNEERFSNTLREIWEGIYQIWNNSRCIFTFSFKLLFNENKGICTENVWGHLREVTRQELVSTAGACAGSPQWLEAKTQQSWIGLAGSLAALILRNIDRRKKMVYASVPSFSIILFPVSFPLYFTVRINFIATICPKCDKILNEFSHENNRSLY